MSGTFSQIYIQIVFAVKGRNVTIGCEWEERLYQYITGIVRNKNQKLIAIGGTASHIHIFVGMKPSCCLSDLVRDIKKASNDFVKENRLSKFISAGKKDLVLFHIVIPKLTMWWNTY
jgi:putative transposase